MPNKLSQFWNELKRRKVIRTITVYAAAAFVILELVSMSEEPFGLPDWTFVLAVILLSIGFIISVIISWIYDVHPEGGIVKTEPAHKVKAEDVPKSSNSWKIASYISFVVIVGLIVLNIIPRTDRLEEIAILEKSIAVLPFENMSSDSEYAYLGGAFTDEIIMELQKIKAFDRVLSRTSTMKYDQNRPIIPVIAEELNVNYIVEGSIQRYEDDVRIRVQVIRAKNEDHIWGDEYDRKWTDIFTIQDDIAIKVAKELQMILSPAEIERIEKNPTTSLKAHQYFQRAREEHTKYWISNDNWNPNARNEKALRNAISLYKSALELDSSYAYAYSGLAMALSNRYYRDINRTLVFDEVEKKIYQDTILSLIDNAMNYNDRLEEAYFVKAQYYVGMQNYDQAIEALDRAIDINPNYSWAYSLKSYILFNNRGDWIEGFKSNIKAVELEKGPLLSKFLNDLALWFEVTGFHQKAAEIYEDMLKLTRDEALYCQNMAGIAWCERDWKARKNWCLRGLEIDSNRVWYITTLINTYLLFEQIDSAHHYLLRLRELAKTEGFEDEINGYIGQVSWAMGKKEDANKIYDQQVKYHTDLLDSKIGWDELNLYFLANIYAERGQNEEALECLQRFDFEIPIESWMIIVMEEFPQFRHLRSDPTFQDILGRLNARWEEEHERVRQWLEENDML